MWNYEAEEAKAVIVIVHGAMEYHGRYEAVAEMWNHIGYHVVMGIFRHMERLQEIEDILIHLMNRGS